MTAPPPAVLLWLDGPETLRGHSLIRLELAMPMNAFTCTGSYAILILYGIKRTENRCAWPEPRAGRDELRSD